MLRTRLLTATAAVALFAAPAAFAQSAPTTAPETPAEMPATSPATAPAAAATPAASEAASAQTPAAAGNIIDTLKAKGEFSTLLTALDNAQLTETLRTQPAISIFAPTDAAFAQLPEADRTRLMDPANAQELRQLLLYHVVVADVNSSQIEGTKGGVETAARTQVQLDGTGDAIKVDDATVTMADIDASNGAIFVIDKVLSPGASQVASGDAEEDAAAPAETAPAASPPVTPPASTTMEEDTTEAAPPAGEAEMTPPADDATPPVATPPASAPSTMAPSSMAPSSMTPSTTTPPAPTPPVEGDPDSDDTAPTPSPTPTPKPAPAPAPVPTPQG
ncbi:fasciclin domain-containing protein [Brevundimonas sp.]|jgi:uncharacterized surface protein with fasciclin (FAS1) repeats|uniref:fasciclin domain-containing protein n=1 Tax=Brevundimonas sp. TaxID=1871086 RepID=UPI003784F219